MSNTSTKFILNALATIFILFNTATAADTLFTSPYSLDQDSPPYGFYVGAEGKMLVEITEHTCSRPSLLMSSNTTLEIETALLGAVNVGYSWNAFHGIDLAINVFRNFTYLLTPSFTHIFSPIDDRFRLYYRMGLCTNIYALPSSAPVFGGGVLYPLNPHLTVNFSINLITTWSVLAMKKPNDVSIFIGLGIQYSFGG
jgi:hypothetical protein